MSEQQLAELTIDFVTKGQDKAKDQINSVGDGMKNADRATQPFVGRLATAKAAAINFARNTQQQLSNVTNKMKEATARAAALARPFAFSGALGIGAFVTGAAQGTIEAEQLSRAVQYLTRVVGDQFAPEMRMVVLAITDAANWLRKLDPETKNNAKQWALLATAVGGFVVVAPVVIGFLGGIIGMFTAVVSVSGAVIAAALAIGKSFVTMGSVSLGAISSVHNALKNGLGPATIGAASGAASATTTAATTAGAATVGATTATAGRFLLMNPWTLFGMAVGVSAGYIANKADEYWNFTGYKGYWFTDSPEEKAKKEAEKNAQQDESRSLLDMAKSTLNKASSLDVSGLIKDMNLGDFSPQSIMSNVTKYIETALDSVIGEGAGSKIDNYLDSLRRRAGDGGFTPKQSVAFESLANTYDRLQLAFANMAPDPTLNMEQKQLKALGDINDGIQDVAAGIQKIADKVGVIR